MIVNRDLCCGLRNDDDLSHHFEGYLPMLRSLTQEHGHSLFSFLEAAVALLENHTTLKFF